MGRQAPEVDGMDYEEPRMSTLRESEIAASLGPVRLSSPPIDTPNSGGSDTGQHQVISGGSSGVTVGSGSSVPAQKKVQR